jgi:hypothetical protein
MDVINAEQVRQAICPSDEMKLSAIRLALQRRLVLAPSWHWSVYQLISANTAGSLEWCEAPPPRAFLLLTAVRQSDPEMIKSIVDAVTIPVMAKIRIGHFVEAQVSTQVQNPASSFV